MENKRFKAKEIKKIDNGKGYWNSVLVGVFDGEEQIGEYKRNYPDFASSTFYAFELNNKWYALYSKDYTSTRIMSLPDCKDIGGEEPDAFGFCPVEFYVPEITGIIFNPEDPQPKLANHNVEKWGLKVENRIFYPDSPNHPQPDENKKLEYLKEKELSWQAFKEWQNRNPFLTQFAKFGFVSGCVWGDDSGWKLQFIDLSEAEKGIIKRDDRFGYLELPNVSLADAVEVLDYDNYLNDPIEKFKVKIAIPTIYNLLGKKV